MKAVTKYNLDMPRITLKRAAVAFAVITAPWTLQIAMVFGEAIYGLVFEVRWSENISNYQAAKARLSGAHLADR